MSIRKMYQIIDIDPPLGEILAAYEEDGAVYAEATLMADGLRHEAALEVNRLVEAGRSAGTHICAGIVEVDAGSVTEQFVGLLNVDADTEGGVIYIRRPEA